MSRGMDCRTTRDCLGEYLDATLPEIVRERVDAHLLDCRDCSRHLSELEYVELRLRKALVPMEPSADFSRNLVERLNDASAESWDLVEVPSESFTASVMGRIQEEIAETEGGVEHGLLPKRNRLPLIRVGMLLAASLLVVLGVLLFRGGFGLNFQPEERGMASLFRVEALDGRALLMDAPSLHVGLEGNLDVGLPETKHLEDPARGLLSKGHPGKKGSSSGVDTQVGGRQTPGQSAEGVAPVKGTELQPGNPIPIGKEVLVLHGEATISARAAQGGILIPRWKLVADAGSRLAFEGASRSHLRRGRLRISRSDSGRDGGAPGFFLGFPGGGGLLLKQGTAEIHVSQDSWALAAGLPEGSAKIQVDLEEGEAFLVDLSGSPQRKLLPGDRAMMRPFEPLRISHGAGVADILSRSADPLRNASSLPVEKGRSSEIRGRLQGSSGNPIAGRAIRLVLPQQVLEGRSNSSGMFGFMPRVEDVVLGAYLSVVVDGTQTVLRFELPPLRPGSRVELTVTLPPIRSLDARILDADGLPLVGAGLRLYQWEPLLKRLVPLGKRFMTTGPTGRAKLVGLPLPREDQRLLLVVEPKDSPLFVGYLDRASLLRKGREGREWVVRSPKLLSVFLEAPGQRRIQVEERPQGPADSLLVRRRELRVVGGRVEIKVALPAPEKLRWWMQDSVGSRVQEGRIVRDGQGARVIAEAPDRLQVQVLDVRGEGISGRRFVLRRKGDGLPVSFGETADGGFATLGFVDARRDLEFQVLDQGHYRSFDLPKTGDLLVARLSFGRIALDGSLGVDFKSELDRMGLRLVGPLAQWRPFSLKNVSVGDGAWKEQRGDSRGKLLGDLQLSLNAGGGARVVPSARVYLLSERGGLALLGVSDLLGLLKVRNLPAGSLLHLLVVHPEEGAATAELLLKPGETRHMLLELQAMEHLGGELPKLSSPEASPPFVEVEVLEGPFAGTRTVAIPGPDGRIDVPGLPAGGSYRFRFGTFEASLAVPESGSPSASPLEESPRVLRRNSWKPVAK